jgi:hypothetical protein
MMMIMTIMMMIIMMIMMIMKPPPPLLLLLNLAVCKQLTTWSVYILRAIFPARTYVYL